MCIILISPDQRIDHFLFERGQCNGKCFLYSFAGVCSLTLVLKFCDIALFLFIDQAIIGINLQEMPFYVFRCLGMEIVSVNA